MPWGVSYSAPCMGRCFPWRETRSITFGAHFTDWTPFLSFAASSTPRSRVWRDLSPARVQRRKTFERVTSSVLGILSLPYVNRTISTCKWTFVLGNKFVLFSDWLKRSRGQRWFCTFNLLSAHLPEPMLLCLYVAIQYNNNNNKKIYNIKMNTLVPRIQKFAVKKYQFFENLRHNRRSFKRTTSLLEGKLPLFDRAISFVLFVVVVFY